MTNPEEPEAAVQKANVHRTTYAIFSTTFP